MFDAYSYLLKIQSGEPLDHFQEQALRNALMVVATDENSSLNDRVFAVALLELARRARE